ncbi:MAG: PilZ domain-containing protein [Candidatus Sumerlaeia bacterium]|nr:PilZ domain-containing protein [Candidatus Sumerlaeia bacterium]
MRDESRGADRRLKPRYPWNVSLRYVSFEADDDLDRQISQATTVDVSETGIQLQSREAIRVGAFVQVAVRTPDRTAPVVILAKTKWCRTDEAGVYRTGLMFMGHIPPAFQDLLSRIEKGARAAVA